MSALDVVLPECPFPPFMGRPLQLLATGVWGLTRDDHGTLVIEMVIAEREGTGSVGRYLDNLSPARKVIVEEVTSARLAGMLERRGYVRARVACFNPTTLEWTSGYVRGAAKDRP